MTATAANKSSAVWVQTSWRVSTVLIFFLVILWQIPGTIAVRNLCLGLLLVGLTFACRGLPISIRDIKPASWILITLSAWIVVVIFLWSPVPQTALSELRGQWLLPLGCWLCGTLTAQASFNQASSRSQSIIDVVFWALLLQVMLHNLLGAWYWIETGLPPFRQAPVFYLPEIATSLWEGMGVAPGFLGSLPDKFSYVNNTLAALLIAEIVQRLLARKRFLNVANIWLVLGAASILLCSFLLRMRNGNVGLMMLILMTGMLLYVRLSKAWSTPRRILVPLAFALMLSGFGYSLYKSDPRWERLTEAVPIALDTVKNRAWLDVNTSHPKDAKGEVVEVSAYERFAWGKEGLLTIAEFPLGLGYNRNAFGVGIRERFRSEPRSQHSHSGVIDFTLANGIPGSLLWLGFLWVVARTGWAAAERGSIALGFMTLFVVTGFLARSVVDSNMRDHILQQFMFFAGLLYMLSGQVLSRGRPQ